MTEVQWDFKWDFHEFYWDFNGISMGFSMGFQWDFLVGALEPWNFMTFREELGIIIIPTDFNSMIFQRGRYTTNQYIILYYINILPQSHIYIYIYIYPIIFYYNPLICQWSPWFPASISEQRRRLGRFHGARWGSGIC